MAYQPGGSQAILRGLPYVATNKRVFHTRPGDVGHISARCIDPIFIRIIEQNDFYACRHIAVGILVLIVVFHR